MFYNKVKSLQFLFFSFAINFLINAKEFTLDRFIKELKTTKKEKVQLKRTPHVFTSEEFKYVVLPRIIKVFIVIECVLFCAYSVSQGFTEDHLKHMQLQFSENSALPGLKSGASAFEAFSTNLKRETFTILVIGC